MIRAALVTALFAVAGCTVNDDGLPAGRSDTRQIPTVVDPGLHIGGHVNIGVSKTL